MPCVTDTSNSTIIASCVFCMNSLYSSDLDQNQTSLCPIANTRLLKVELGINFSCDRKPWRNCTTLPSRYLVKLAEPFINWNNARTYFTGTDQLTHTQGCLIVTLRLPENSNLMIYITVTSARCTSWHQKSLRNYQSYRRATGTVNLSKLQ